MLRLVPGVGAEIWGISPSRMLRRKACLAAAPQHVLINVCRMVCGKAGYVPRRRLQSKGAIRFKQRRGVWTSRHMCDRVRRRRLRILPVARGGAAWMIPSTCSSTKMLLPGDRCGQTVASSEHSIGSTTATLPSRVSATVVLLAARVPHG